MGKSAAALTQEQRDALHLLRSVVTWGGVREVIGDDLYERALLALDKIGEKP